MGKEAKNENFGDTVYQLLREFQEGKIQKSSVFVAVGGLSPELSTVYDKIIAAHEEVIKPKKHARS